MALAYFSKLRCPPREVGEFQWHSIIHIIRELDVHILPGFSLLYTSFSVFSLRSYTLLASTVALAPHILLFTGEGYMLD
jgi:hypothetical protein